MRFKDKVALITAVGSGIGRATADIMAKEGAVVISPYNRSMPENVRAAADKVIAGYKDGSYDVFTGPITDQAGKERVAKGDRMAPKDLATIDWFVKGVQS